MKGGGGLKKTDKPIRGFNNDEAWDFLWGLCGIKWAISDTLLFLLTHVSIFISCKLWFIAIKKAREFGWVDCDRYLPNTKQSARSSKLK